MKSITNILPFQVDCRGNNMAGLLSAQLDDALSKISIDYFHSLFFQIIIQSTFFG